MWHSSLWRTVLAVWALDAPYLGALSLPWPKSMPGAVGVLSPWGFSEGCMVLFCMWYDLAPEPQGSMLRPSPGGLPASLSSRYFQSLGVSQMVWRKQQSCSSCGWWFLSSLKTISLLNTSEWVGAVFSSVGCVASKTWGRSPKHCASLLE